MAKRLRWLAGLAWVFSQTISCTPMEGPAAHLPLPDAAVRDHLEPPELLRIDVRSASSSWPSIPPGSQRWSVWTQAGESFEAIHWGEEGSVALILPHLDGSQWVYRYLVQRLAAEDIGVLAILPPSAAIRQEPAATDMLWVLRQRIRMGRLAVRLLQSSPDTCIVVAGLSLGALAAIPIGALEPRVQGIVTLMGGGDLSWIAEHSAEHRIRNLVDDRAPLDRHEVSALDLDPIAWAPLVGRRPVLLIDGIFDRVIPSESSAALASALPHSTRHSFPSGHYSFVLFLRSAISKVARHIDRVCRIAAEPSTEAGLPDAS